MKNILITKADGEKELFNDTKLRSSLERAGASLEIVNKVVEHIERELEEGMTTSHIYKHAFFVLRKLEKPIAARYSLRRAMVDLGPSGFPFEKFLAELLKSSGYETAVDQTVKGSCVSHEIDVVAYNNEKLVMIEAKFHNTPAEKTDLKVALYVKARFDDLIEQSFFYGKRRQLDEGWLVTNTKFTERAIEYGQCAGLKMIGWNYPEKGNLQDMIEDIGLHPITCLSSLNGSEKRQLLDNGMVLCRAVKESELELERLGFSKEKVKKIMEEANIVCQPN